MNETGGATLRGYLRAIAEAGADVALVTSFNEWPETTIVEPSSSWADPYQYLKILAERKGMSFASPRVPALQRKRIAPAALRSMTLVPPASPRPATALVSKRRML